MAQTKKASEKVNIQKMVFSKLNVQKEAAKKALIEKQKTDRENFREKQKLERLALTESFSAQVKSIADNFMEFLSNSDKLQTGETTVAMTASDVAGLKKQGSRAR